ncbi:alkaline phosphatase family protein [Bacillaceae bacterium Marseille-Q3522]|nr:alkaline phosphatase family protein [Bacillaceae bacterium Marseille-Q3522]
MDASMNEKKPVIMLVIDTLMDEPLQAAIRSGRAPALKFLIEKGQYYPKVVTAFPTMSVTIDTTILTGTYCDHHHLPGLVWFQQQENRLINYGTHFRELWKLGLGQAVEDLLFQLNEHHISDKVETIHETLDKNGADSASINALIYRGNTMHFYHFPKLFTWLSPIQNKKPIMAAKNFSYGSLSKFNPSNRYQHFWQKFGFNNRSAITELIYLIKNNRLPLFTFAYLPDLDKRVHKYGRMDVKGVEIVDQQLQKLFDTYPSWEEALSKNIWITLGDNGQAHVVSARAHAQIDLQKLLLPYKIMKLSKGVQKEDQIVLAVNDRMAYIYSIDTNKLPEEEIARWLQTDNRIDVIAWKNAGVIKVRSGIQEGELIFQRNGTYVDQYEQSWSINGNVSLLDLHLQNNRIEYCTYPDALARLHSSLHSHEGNFLVVSAKPGHEFIGEASPSHVGGAGHGALHEQDSNVPMIINGTSSCPETLRMVDLKKWILSLLDI